MSFRCIAAFFLLSACTPQLSTENASCPCTTGSVCCQAKNICVEPSALAACEGPVIPASCTNGVKDGSETAVDCGGGTCPRCIVTLACGGSNDCRSGVCTAGLCAPPEATLVLAAEENAASAPTAAAVTTLEPFLTYVFSVETAPAHGAASVSEGKFTYTPDNDFFGADTFTFRANASDNSFVIGTAAVTVSHVNKTPTISGTPTTSLKAGQPYSFTPTASDVDPGDTLTFSAQNLPGWLTIDANTGALSGTPSNGDVGVFSGIVITVHDSASATATLAAFSITVITSLSPSPVTDLSAGPGDQKISLAWTNPGDANFTGVTIQSAAGACPASPLDGINVYEGTAEYVVITGLTNDVALCFAAFSHDDKGNYAAGDVLTATPRYPWQSGADMPTGQWGHAVAVSGTKIYVSGGAADEALLQEYDPASDTWTNCGTAAPGNACPALPTPRSFHGAATAATGRMFIMGGNAFAGGAPWDVVEEYDPSSNSWTNCSAISAGGCAGPSSDPADGQALAVATSTDIFLVGGEGSGGNFKIMQEYDPASNIWTNCGNADPSNACGSLPAAPFGSGAALTLTEYGLQLFGGHSYSGVPSLPDSIFTQNEKNPDFSWHSAAALTKGRGDAVAVTLSAVVYLIGGNSCDSATDTSCTAFAVDTVEAYYTQSGAFTTADTWSTQASLPDRRAYAAGVAYGGKIYVFGGQDLNFNTKASVYIYDPTYDW